MNLIFRKTWTEYNELTDEVHKLAAYIQADRPLTDEDRDELAEMAGVMGAYYHGPGLFFAEEPWVKIRGKRAIVRQSIARDV